MKKILLTIAILLALFSFFGNGRHPGSKNHASSEWPKDTIQLRADSLLKAGNKGTALNLYFLVVNLNEPYTSIQFSVFEKIGNIYLERSEFQQAIYFFRQYEWMATQQIEFNKGNMPTAGAEWWAQTDAQGKALEKKLKQFSQKLRELENKHLK